MLCAIARRNTILEMLREQQSVNVTQLAAALGVATETIRRDLKELESSLHRRTWCGGRSFRRPESA